MSPLRAPLSSRLAASFTLLALASSSASAQGVEYDLENLGPVPGAYLTYGNGLNDHGVVVGDSIFIPGGHKAWTWSTGQGHTVLPAPPGSDGYGAVDINNAGVIAGDGGGDGGEIWRYTNGTYEMLGVLPGTPIPHAERINEAGSITGTCFGTLFYYPRHSFQADPGVPMYSVLDNSEAFGINDAGQVTGNQGLDGYRITPGVGVEFLPPLGAKYITVGNAVNNAGKVVGSAESGAEHSDVPFLFSNADGMQEIGNFGGRAWAIDVNDADEVVGNHEPGSGSHMPWVWSKDRGVRFLNDVIDPSLGIFIRYVHGINNAGQILCDTYHGGDYVPLLLTPVTYCQPDVGFGGPGDAALGICGDPLLGGGSAELLLDSSVPNAPAFLGWGMSFNPTPFGAGTIVPMPLAGTTALTTDASGNVLVPGIPGGGGPLVLYVQGVVVDPLQPGGLQFTNAVEMHLFP